MSIKHRLVKLEKSIKPKNLKTISLTGNQFDRLIVGAIRMVENNEVQPDTVENKQFISLIQRAISHKQQYEM